MSLWGDDPELYEDAARRDAKIDTVIAILRVVAYIVIFAGLIYLLFG